MSTTHDEAPHDEATTATESSASTLTRGDTTGVPGQRRPDAGTSTTPGTTRRRVAIGAAVALTLTVVGGGVAVWKSAQPKHSATSAMVLPATVGALGPIAQVSDPMKAERFQTRAKEAVGGAPYAAQMYGTATNERTIRVVAARTDLTKKLDEVMAVDAGTVTDGVSCTQNVQLVAGGRSAVRPTVMLCWRNSPTLSVYTLIIDPRSPQVSTPDGVASVKQVWDFVR